MAKVKVATKVFLLPGGGESKDVDPSCEGIRFKFTNGDDLDFLFESVDEAVRRCAMARGFSEDIGNTYAASGGNVANARQWAGERIEALQSGDWYSDRTGGGGGPNLAILIEAVGAAKKKENRPFNADETKAKLLAKDGRVNALKVPTIRAEYDRLMAERAAAKAVESAKAASVDAGDLSSF